MHNAPYTLLFSVRLTLQVYKKLDIGSNKPSAEERAEVPHHLIDVADADSEVGQY